MVSFIKITIVLYLLLAYTYHGYSKNIYFLEEELPLSDIISPTSTPTSAPSSVPTGTPTLSPTGTPTSVPTGTPTSAPSGTPTSVPTGTPTSVPTGTPTSFPTGTPTSFPTGTPSSFPTVTPTQIPTFNLNYEPTYVPTEEPTDISTEVTLYPTEEPTYIPTEETTLYPTEEPTHIPTEEVTLYPTEEATQYPTEESTLYPTEESTLHPTEESTLHPTEESTLYPTEELTLTPTEETSTRSPTEEGTRAPTEEGTRAPTEESTRAPTEESQRTMRPTSVPSRMPTPTSQFKTDTPSTMPSSIPTKSPSFVSYEPSPSPTNTPSTRPSSSPSLLPTSRPTMVGETNPPTRAPISARPTKAPSVSQYPTASPTRVTAPTVTFLVRFLIEGVNLDSTPATASSISVKRVLSTNLRTKNLLREKLSESEIVNLDEATQFSIVEASAASQGVDPQYVAFSMAIKESSTSFTAITRTTLPLIGEYASLSVTELVALISKTLSENVAKGTFTTVLQEASRVNGATLTQSATSSSTSLDMSSVTLISPAPHEALSSSTGFSALYILGICLGGVILLSVVVGVAYYAYILKSYTGKVEETEDTGAAASPGKPSKFSSNLASDSDPVNTKAFLKSKKYPQAAVFVETGEYPISFEQDKSNSSFGFDAINIATL